MHLRQKEMNRFQKRNTDIDAHLNLLIREREKSKDTN